METTDSIKMIAAQQPLSASILDMAQACRASNFSATQCAPTLFTLFPQTSANDFAAVLVEVWACELPVADLTTALQSCMNNGVPAYTAAQITAAVAAAMSLNFLDVAHVPTMYGSGVNLQLKMIGFSQGDLSKVTPSENAEFLLISCLPGDYSPTPGSMIAALQSAYGINIASLAQNPAADYRSTLNCWISQNLSSSTGASIPYKQLIVFESTGANAPANIPGLFTAIKTYVPNPPPIPNTGATIISALLSTGSAGGDPTAVLTALFNGCWNLMTGGPGYNMTCFRIIVFKPNPALVTVFDQLKQSHGGH